jgi:hypothetical protein
VTDPVCSAAPPDPAVVELEPILISARPTAGASMPVPVGEIATRCMSKLDAVAIAALGAPASPLLAGLVAFKAGLELGECIATTLHEVAEDASVRRALEQCADAGGHPESLIAGTLTCEVPVEVAP